MGDSSKYTVGWICAITTEYVAAKAFLDREHVSLEYGSANDNNIYTLGEMGNHNVVIAQLPEGEYGIAAAASVARDMVQSFSNIRIGLMVGIGGGAPNEKHDIRLGDIVISAPYNGKGGLFQYEFGKTIQDQEFRPTGFLNQPPGLLRAAMGDIKAKYEMEGHQLDETIKSVLEKRPKLRKKYKRPDLSSDRLYQSHIVHPDNDERSCEVVCGDDESKLIVRRDRSDEDDNPAIHYGLIASANQVMKNAVIRDRLAAEKDVLCFEMEAAGLMNHFPCLVIRGICDYSDSHKNKEWQGYAAMTAAAYAKDLLSRIPPNKVEAEQRISDVLSLVQEMKWTLNEIAVGQKQHAIFEWLSPLSPSARHFENQKKRVKHTGTWLLNDPKFLDWSSKIANCQILCCYGDPGAGKTIISSLVIDHLREHIVPGSKIGLGYMYCDYRAQEEQTTEDILGAVLTQLLRILPEMPEAVLKLYGDRVNQKKPLSLEDANNLFHITCSQFSEVYVCLDALDELGDLRGLLKSLRDGPSSIRIFLTGRPHVQEIVQENFKGEHSITIKAHESDIRLFVEHEIGGPNDIEPKAMDERLRIDILEKVVDSAKGIFLLPTLQIRAVLQATTLRDREEALKELPSNLGEAFNGTMTRIQQQPVALSERAAKIIAWIHLSERSLTINELLCSLAIQDGDTCFNPRGIPVRETLLNCCYGLAVNDQETSTVRLVHYSLQQHLLQQNEIFNLSKAQWHSKIARTCLTFLKFPPLTTGEAQEQNHTTITILRYAATQWGHHLRRSGELPGPALEFGKEYLLANRTNNSVSLRLLYKAMYAYRFDKIQLNYFLPVHIAAFFGLREIMLHLSSTALNLDVRDMYGQTPLSWAARKGHEAVVKVLIEKGAAVDSVDRNGLTPLSWAAENGHESVVKVLIKKGAAVDSVDIDGLTPLSWAARQGHETVVKVLIEKGAAVDSEDTMYGQTPLSWAARQGHESVVKVLIDKGAAVDSVDRHGYTPLSWAARKGHETVVKVLIEKGAAVDSVNKNGRTPLSWAAWMGHEAVVKMLIEKGAAVDLVDTKYGQTPLSWAIVN